MRNGTRRDLLMMLILTVITGGLYYFYWAYKTSKEMDEFTGERGIPPIIHLILLICTVSLWGYVWDILTAQKIERMQRMVGIPARNQAGLYIVLDFLGAGPIYGIGIVVPFLQQNDLNEIYAVAGSKKTWR